MAELTGSEILAKALKKEGTENLFFIMGGPMLLGLVAMNAADHWLHVALAVVILAAGFLLEDEPAMA